MKVLPRMFRADFIEIWFVNDKHANLNNQNPKPVDDV